MMTRAGNLFISGAAPWPTQITLLLLRASRGGSIQGQSYESRVLEGFVAFGLACDRNRGLPGRRRIQPLAEITQGIVAKSATPSS